MVEYCRVVTDVTGPVGAAPFDLFPTDDMKNSLLWGGWGGAARHLKTINILYGGGNAESKTPMAISPVNADNVNRFWRPLLDQPK